MLEIIPIKAFSDNYLWLFRQEGSDKAAIVDPGDAGPVLAYLEHGGLSLGAIVITHHHADHTGGILPLLQHYDVPVYGPASRAIPQVTQVLQEGDNVTICNTPFSVLEIPGHTLDHIAYFAALPAAGQNPVLFCGDTLFAAGCGRLFEGTPAMMYESLQKLAHLPADTAVYCAHEYTLANLAFAEAVTPGNRQLQQRIQQEKSKRQHDLPTLPTTVGRELATNPFLRCDADDIKARFPQQAEVPAEVFAALRSWKDSF